MADTADSDPSPSRPASSDRCPADEGARVRLSARRAARSQAVLDPLEGGLSRTRVRVCRMSARCLGPYDQPDSASQAVHSAALCLDLGNSGPAGPMCAWRFASGVRGRCRVSGVFQLSAHESITRASWRFTSGVSGCCRVVYESITSRLRGWAAGLCGVGGCCLVRCRCRCWYRWVLPFFLDLSMVDRRLHNDLRKLYLYLKAPRFDLHRPVRCRWVLPPGAWGNRLGLRARAGSL
jgi:hypothetical protein